MQHRLHSRGLFNVHTILQRFFSDAKPMPKPNLNFPAASNRIGIFGFMLLGIPAVTFGLGTWQIKRWKWKLKLIESLLEKTKSDPVELPEDLAELASLEYRPVRMRGSYDHGRELYIGPRSQIIQGGDEQLGRSGLLSAGCSGVQVVTPFRLAGSDREVLVNRGWVPTRLMAPSQRTAGQIEGEHEIIGLVRASEKRGRFMPKNVTSKKAMFLYRDVAALSEQAGTEAVFVDLTLDAEVPDAPAAGQTRVTLRNEHLSYILTWYILSVATLVMWWRRFVMLPGIRARAVRQMQRR